MTDTNTQVVNKENEVEVPLRVAYLVGTYYGKHSTGFHRNHGTYWSKESAEEIAARYNGKISPVYFTRHRGKWCRIMVSGKGAPEGEPTDANIYVRPVKEPKDGKAHQVVGHEGDSCGSNQDQEGKTDQHSPDVRDQEGSGV